MVKASLVLYNGGKEAGQIGEVAVLEATLHRQVHPLYTTLHRQVHCTPLYIGRSTHCTPLLVPLDVCTSYREWQPDPCPGRDSQHTCTVWWGIGSQWTQ